MRFSLWTLLFLMFAALTPASAQQGLTVGANELGGVVAGPSGPEAGVWVIAETSELPTKFAKIVVTDDQGRYLIPDLPKANYDVWVRGYGLVDSQKMKSEPGRTLNLTAVKAPSEKDAAKYYPAIYWYAMLKIPDASQFGGKSDIPEKLTQVDWLKQMKNIGCIGCHQLGQESTRAFPAALGEFKSHEEAWMRRIQSGQSGEQMTNQLAGNFGGAPFKYYADWTRAIEKGELPKAKPTRPQGLERNVVVTWWEWGSEKQYLHDLIASDRRDPKVNANGPLYGSPEYSTDNMPILDPKAHKVTFFKMPVRDPNMPESLGPGHAASIKPLAPSPYWGDEKLWDTRANNHNAMFDKKGRVWIAANVRGMDNPDFCKKGSEHPSAKVFPLERSPRQVAMLDPKTMKYTFVDTCFGSHHLQFDAKDRVWTSGSGQVAGWIDTKVFDETGDAAKAQGWSPFILDSNGNGKRDEFTEPNQPTDANKDARVTGGSGPYAVMPNPADGSVWYTVGVFAGRGGVLRFDPETGLSEVYNVPMPGFGPRGGDIDSKGVVWVSLGSGHIGSFDRKKCKGPLNGSTATGDHCPEG
ncbi:MAG: carboxypeptidase regulatory-like domain-containing protein, partial [Xanthobacteraceae bacterium]